MSFISNLFGGGGGGGGSTSAAPQQTSSNVYQTNIPEYAQPYVQNMLNATQSQIFNTDASGNVTGFNQYQPYSGMNQQEYNNAAQAVAGFSPLQQQAQSSAANLSNSQMPGITGASAYGSLMAGRNLQNQSTNPNAINAYMNPYIQNALAPSLALQNQQFGQLNAQNQAQATQQGAFGGGRQAVMQGLNQQNQMLAQNQLVGNAYNTAFGNAQNQMNQVAQLGLQGYGQAGSLAGQQLAQQQGIIGTQAQQGAAQQANAQQIINQGIQNYATAQQYPLMQLGTMSNMLRGLPMQATTTQQYQAAPTALAQGVGMAGTAAMLGSAYGAKGGLPSEFKKGIKGYAVGGVIGGTQSDLEDMPTDALQKEMSVTQSPTIRNQIKQILQARAGAQYAGGGIIAFSDSTEANNQSLVKDDSKELYPGQLRDAAMYQGIGNFAKEAGSNIINPFNSLVNTGKSIINWGQTDPRIQAQQFREASARNEQAANPTFVPPPTQQTNPTQDWQGSANVASAPTAQTPPPPPAAKTAPGAITNVSPKPAVDPHVLATKASEEKTIKDGNDPNIPGYIKPLTEEEMSAQRDKHINEMRKFLGPDDSEAQLAKLDKRLERESKTFDKNEKLTFAGMFARMATTPGSFITAAMTGVQQGLPQLISNNEKRDQAINAVEDAKAAIAKAKRAEALGLYSKSHKETMEAAKYMMESNKIVVESQDKRYVADVGLEGHKIAAAATIEGHKISAGATKENTNYLAANRLQENADSSAEKARASKPYVDAQKDVVTFKDNTSQFAKNKVAAAQKIIDDTENRIKINQARIEKVVNNLTPDRFKTDNTSSKVIKLD